MKVVRVLLILYLAFGAFALTVAVVDPGDDPLSAVFLVIAAMPWTSAAGWLLDRLGEPPLWLPYLLLSAAVVLNALLLYVLGRLLRRR
jgi:membrane protein DedA with SNARE-associated domain